MRSKSKRILIVLLLLITYSLTKPYFSRDSYIAQIEKALDNSILKEQLLSKECKLYDDKDGIAHTKGETELQAYACWGFLHGRDRAGQMDYLRRIAYGRKAEVGSYKDIKSDFFINVIGISEKAKQIYTQMSPTSQKLLLAYSFGVNRALLDNIQQKKVYEFEKLQIFPEPWQPENSIAVLLLQSLEQTKDNFLKKLDEENWKQQHGDKAQTLFTKEQLPWETFIIKADDTWATQMATKKPATASLDHHPTYQLNTQPIIDLRKSLFPEENWGSNSWVLNADKTESKKAWLANDPHLSLKNPPFWYWLHVEAPEFNTIGANLPGAPVFANGTNPSVSWGLTNSYLPVGNLYFVAKKEIENDNKLTTTHPLIWFKFWKFKIPFFFKSYQRLNSQWPLLPIDLHPELSLIYHWSSLDLEAKDFEAFFDLAKVKSTNEIDQVFRRLKLNSWNFVFADVNGNIGYRATGLVHRFEQKPEFGITVKSYDEVLDLLAAKNYLTADEIPHLLNPKRGYVVTANNRQWKQQGMPFYLGASSNSEFRAYRIEELLADSKQNMNLEKIKAVQCDNQAQDARIFLPLLNNYLVTATLDSDSKEALNILNQWNFKTTIDCKECFLFRRWMSLIYESEHLNVIAFYKSLSEANINNKEHFTTALLEQLKLSYHEYKLLINKSANWGDLHVNQFPHLWGDDFASSQTIATPGDEETVNPGTADWDGRVYKQRSGASQRLVIEMTNPPKVYSSLAGENKDHEIPALNDPNFAWSKWANCELSQKMFPLDWQNLPTSKITFY